MTWFVTDLEVCFGDVVALSDVSLELPAEGIVVVVGADGAGKTTLLRVFAGSQNPGRGHVRRPSSTDIGFVSADSAVYADLTVAENLTFAARAYGVREHRDRMEELLEITKLTSARDRLAGHLSGGMRQKLGVAMATIHRPKLIVLDEPTTGLDPVSRAEIWGMLAEEAAGGTTILVSTAYLEEAERGSQVLVLDEGRVLVSGTARDVIDSVPGAVLEAQHAPEHLEKWRRGRMWRAWAPDGQSIASTSVVRPDIEDAVIIAALRRESR